MDKNRNTPVLIGRFDFSNHDHVKFLFDTYYDGLVYWAQRFLKNMEDAEDTVEDVFVKLIKKGCICNDLKEAKNLLYLSTRNKCFDRLEKKKNEEERHIDYIEKFSLEEDDERIENESKVAWNKFFNLIETTITKLQKKIFYCRYVEGMDITDTAENLHLKRQTVKNNSKKAIDKIKNRVKSDKGFIELLPFLLK